MTAPAIIASYFTLAGDLLPHAPRLVSPIPVAERIDAAARAGFSGMGFFFDDAADAIATHGAVGLRGMLADAGMRWVELEALADWFADGDRRTLSDHRRQMALAQARDLGAFQIKIAGDMAGDCPLDRMAQELAALADQAREAGARVVIELLPFSNLPSVERGVALVEAAGRSNVGLMFDAWHVARGHIPLGAIAALPPAMCMGVELDDGAAVPELADLYDDTVYRRRLPGEGEFDLHGLIVATRAAGFDGPYGIEILSDAHRALGVEEAASRAYRAAAALFGE